MGLAMAAMPFANTHAENINIYGWQDWSYEWVDNDAREWDRLQNNSANIGFLTHMDTGIEGLQVGFRCEQYTFFSNADINDDWCSRESKISLRHETMGEIMFAQWLLPYNQIVAQWVDPFYDAGADSHSSIMGNIGGETRGVNVPGGFTGAFYAGSFGGFSAGDNYGALSFNRRQEGIVQYVWPNASVMGDQSRDGFQFRFAVTDGQLADTDITYNNGTATERTVNIDPRIMSTGVAYQHNMGNDQIWLAAAYEYHEDTTANILQGVAQCADSEDEGIRLAGRYKHDWGDGQSTWIAGMYEKLDYDSKDCKDGTGADFTVINQAPIWTGVERDAWMISGKHSFGNGLDIRASYMDADDLECDNAVCVDNPGTNDVDERAASQNNTAADAFNIGLFYTMPAGTELRATYSEVSNEANAGYDFGIGVSGVAQGNDVEMFAVGIVHWFD